MSATFRTDLAAPGTAFPHFWETLVGSGHAPLALRADWQAQMRRARDELGFRGVRFHGILSDDMGTLIDVNHELLHSFHNADTVFDFLVSIDVRPFVELSFMPRALSSGDATVFHYEGNITPPRDMAQWATLVGRVVSHWVERYGIVEVAAWHFEVWNEPNLTFFWTGTQAEYFELYRATAEAVKGVDARLRVGGPATAANAWVAEFVAFCRTNAVPVDFVSTHHYPTDAFGSPGDDTLAQLAASHLGVLREQSTAVREQAGDLPVHYTEWCTSSNSRDPLHDEPWAAAYLTRAVMEQQGIVQGYSWWTFSDIFEENYFPSVPFHGGFGLMNLHGVPKPAWRAFELLHGLGERRLEVRGEHDTVAAWAVADAAGATVLLVNLALPRHAIGAERVRLAIAGAASVADASVRRIDAAHANPKAVWEAMGSPDYPTPAQVRELQAASALSTEPLALSRDGDSVHVELELAPQSVAAVRLDASAPA